MNESVLGYVLIVLIIYTGICIGLYFAYKHFNKYGISESVIGLSIVALGTSLPEFAVTVISALRGHKGVALGNVLGSNVMNILGILGIASIVGGGIVVSSNFANGDIWLLLLSSGFVCGMLLNNREIGRGVGFSMVLGYLTYMALLFS